MSRRNRIIYKVIILYPLKHTTNYYSRLINYFTFKNSGESGYIKKDIEHITMPDYKIDLKITKEITIPDPLRKDDHKYLIVKLDKDFKKLEDLNGFAKRKTTNVRIPHLIVQKYNRKYFKIHNLKLRYDEEVCPACYGTKVQIFFSRNGLDISNSNLEYWHTNCEACKGMGDYTTYLVYRMLPYMPVI